MVTQPVVIPDFNDINLDEFGAEYEPKALVLQGEVALEKIKDDTSFQRVARAGLDAAANIRSIEAYLAPLKERQYAAWKRTCTVLSDKIKPFEEVKKKASQLCGVYQYEQEQARLAAEAIERARLAEEEANRRAQEAEQLASEGRIEEGVAVLESPTVTSAPVVSSGGAPKVAGLSAASEKYHAEIRSKADFMKLVKAVAEGRIPPMALRPTCSSWKGLPDCPLEVSFLDKQAGSMKALLAYDGVTAVREFSSSFRPK